MLNPADLRGKVITFDEIGCLPPRIKFLEQQIVDRDRAILATKVDFEFLPINVKEIWLPEKDGRFAMDKYAFRMYKIAMYGVLRSGEKITVVLDGIQPFFEIRIKGDERKFMEGVQTKILESMSKCKGTEIIHNQATTKEYQDFASFVVLKFNSTGERSKLLKIMIDAGYETYHDDSSCYYRVVNRDLGFPWTSWITVSQYVVVKNHPFFGTMWTVCVNYKNIDAFQDDIFADPELCNDKTLEVSFDIETFDPTPPPLDDVPQPTSPSAVMFQISMCFIFVDGALFPVNATLGPSQEGYEWALPNGHLVYYLITMAPQNAMPNRTVIQCRNMVEMIQAFGLIIKLKKPDYFEGFNIDNYDWRWIGEKARQYNLLEFLEKTMSIFQFAKMREIDGTNFINPKSVFTANSDKTFQQYGLRYPYWEKYGFKISAELQSFPGAYMAYHGYTNIDYMPQLRAMCGNPEKWSLHYFLGKFGLGDKVDMPYKEMFAKYARNKKLYDLLMQTSLLQIKEAKILKGEKIDGTESPDIKPMELDRLADELGILNDWLKSKAEMVDVGEYCLVDSIRCHDLGIKTQYIKDRRQIGALSYTSFDDCVYKANGMKVRNLTIASAVRRGLHISNKPPASPEIGKYPGAYVFPPKKGVAYAKPSPAELRKSELPEHSDWKFMPQEIFDKCLVKIAEWGIMLHDYGANDLVGEYPKCFMEWLAQDSHYPIAGLDFSSLYPSLIMTYNFSPEMMVHSIEKALMLAENPNIKLYAISFKFNGRDITGWSIRHKYSTCKKDIEALLKRLAAAKTRREEYIINQELDIILIAVEFGIFPSTLKALFDTRAAIKVVCKALGKRIEHIEQHPCQDNKENKAEKEKEKEAEEKEYKSIVFKFNYLKLKEKALKVFMNTFYGESGNALSPIRVLALAGGVTTSGQYNIKLVASLVQKLDCRIYYGDSVTGDTPIMLLDRSGDEPCIMIRTFNDLCANKWHQTQTEKDLSEEWNNYYVWSSGGWAHIKSIVRHQAPGKKIIRVSTHTGLIDVTEDHSLLDFSGEKIKPSECKIGTELRHGYPIYKIPTNPEKIHDDDDDEPITRIECLAFIYGFFYGDGSCGKYGFGSNVKYSWNLNNNNIPRINKLLKYLHIAYPGKTFKYQDIFENSGVYKIVSYETSIKVLFEEYRPQFYDSLKYKKVPDIIINSTLDIKRFFIMGYYMVDGVKTNGINVGKIGTTGIYYLMKCLGFKCSISCIIDKEDIYKVICTTGSQHKDPYKIKYMKEIRTMDSNEYVYDITTEDGTFAAGIGEIIVHNTDSVYVSMPHNIFLEDNKKYYSLKYEDWSPNSKIEYFSALISKSFKHIEIVNKQVNDALESDNGTSFLNMAFEEFLWPTAFYSKKKYCGVPHEGIFNKLMFDLLMKHIPMQEPPGTISPTWRWKDDLTKLFNNKSLIFVRGLEYIKKGVNQMLVDISIELLCKSFHPFNYTNLFDLVCKKIEQIYTQPDALGFDKFIKTDCYKPKKENIKVQTFHARMKEIGLAPEPLDRFKYVIVKKYPFKYDLKGRKSALSVGDRMEYSDRARELGMEIDLDYYMAAAICGQLARFISWHSQFYIEPKDANDEDELKAIDDKIITSAKKFIAKMYEKWSEKHFNKGPALKSLYKKINTSFHTEFSQIVKTSALWRTIETPGEDKSDFDNIMDTIEAKSSTEAKVMAKKIITLMEFNSIGDAGPLAKVYKEIYEDRFRMRKVKKPVLIKILRDLTAKFAHLLRKRDQLLEDEVSRLGTEIGASVETKKNPDLMKDLDLMMDKIQHLDSLDQRIKPLILKTFQIDDFKLLLMIDDVYIKILSLETLCKTADIVYTDLYDYVTVKTRGNKFLTMDSSLATGIEEFLDEDIDVLN